MSLYLKLIIKSLLRHQKKGKKLFIFTSICIAAILFCIAMSDSFYVRYMEAITDSYCAHISVISKESTVGSEMGIFSIRTEDLPLIKVTDETERYVKDIKGVKAVSKMIRMFGSFFTIDSDSQGLVNIIGYEPEKLKDILPGLVYPEGIRDFKYDQTAPDIPVLRSYPRDSEIIKNNDNFILKDFRLKGGNLEKFKIQIVHDFNFIFPEVKSGSISNELFIKSLNEGIKNKNMFEKIPDKMFSTYDAELDNAITKIKTVSDLDEKEIRKWNKRIIRACYKKQIAVVPEEISLNKPLTIVVPPAKSDGDISLPKVIPVKFVGYVKSLPLYSDQSYIDINAFQKYLKLTKEECLELSVRIKNIKDIPEIKKEIQKYLNENNLDYKIVTYKEVGSAATPTATAFQIGLLILSVLFMILIIIFIINLVLLSIVRRKREIGTSLVLGMDKWENVFVLLGEVFIIITVSWIAGSVTGSAVILTFKKIGLPGMIFFNTGKLYFSFNAFQIFIVYLMIAPLSILAGFIPALALLKMKPVDILREAE